MPASTRTLTEAYGLLKVLGYAREDLDCTLCSELAGDSMPLHMAMMDKAPRVRVLEETRNFVVVPSIGPLAPGHIMLVPRRHDTAILGLPRDCLLECEHLLRRCSERLALLYGGFPLVFEHGSTRSLNGGANACIDHAHIHMISGPVTFIRRVQRMCEGWASSVRLTDLTNEVKESPYLMVGTLSISQTYHVHALKEQVPSQLLRRLLADELGRPSTWDWRRDPREEVFLRTILDWREGRDGLAEAGSGQGSRVDS